MDLDDEEKKLYKRFQKWQGVLAFLHIAAATTLGVYASAQDKDWTTSVYYKYNAWVGLRDEDGCSKGCSIQSVETTVSDDEISLAWAAASFSYISGLHHLFAFFKPETYTGFVRGVNWPRWIDYAFSSGIMFVIIGILFTAPPDYLIIFLYFSSQFLVIVSGAGSEVAWYNNDKNNSIILFVFAFLGFLAPWVALFQIFHISIYDKATENTCGDLLDTDLYSNQSPPDFVWIAVIGLFVTFASFAINHIFKILKAKPDDFTSTLKFEVVYSFLSFTSKILLLADIGIAVVERSNSGVGFQDIGTIQKEEEEENATTLTWFMVAVALLSIGLGIGLFVSFKELFQERKKGAKEVVQQSSTTVVVKNSLIF